jgi:hypothetical protein
LSDYIALSDRIVNNELERMWKVLSWHLPGGTDKNHEDILHRITNPFQGYELNPAPSKHEAGLLPT